MHPLLICALTGLALPSQAGNLRLVEDERAATVTAFVGERPCFVYNFGTALTRPFIHPLYTPAGREVTRDSPPGHVHHHGLMLAYGNIARDGDNREPYVNFWADSGEPAGLGRIVHKGLDELRAGPDAARIVARNEWRRISDDALFLTERRTITLLRPESGEGCLLTWRSDLTAAGRPLIFGGTPGLGVSYYGLGLRVPEDMDGGQLLDANGKTGVEAVNGDDARWCAYVGGTQGLRGFAMLDHPDNPRHPTGWFVMNRDFGYMTASLVCHEPYSLPAGATLSLRYGLVVFDIGPGQEGDRGVADFVEQQYRRWLERERAAR
jgi:hypothetical protein